MIMRRLLLGIVACLAVSITAAAYAEGRIVYNGLDPSSSSHGSQVEAPVLVGNAVRWVGMSDDPKIAYVEGTAAFGSEVGQRLQEAGLTDITEMGNAMKEREKMVGVVGVALAWMVSGPAAADRVIVADTTGTNNFLDPSFYGVEFASGGGFIESITYDVSVWPDAFFDFNGVGSFMDLGEPVLDLGSLVGLTGADITFVFDEPHSTFLTAAFAPGSFGPGDSFRFAADTDFLVSDPAPGSVFGEAMVPFSVTMDDGAIAVATFEVVSDTQSIATVVLPSLAADRTLMIKQGACPAPVNPGSNGLTPILLVGDVDFDVDQVILSSLEMSRCDGVGGAVAPHSGPPGPGIQIVDLNHPNDDDVGCEDEQVPCACNEDQSSDGIDDLRLTFKTSEMAEAFLLDGVPGGSTITLFLTGELTDGTQFVAADCIRVVGPPVPAGTLIVEASALDVWVDVTPVDQILDGGGFTSFERSYALGTIVTLTAPLLHNGRVFLGWLVNGELVSSYNTVGIGVEGDVTTAVALYVNPYSRDRGDLLWARGERILDD